MRTRTLIFLVCVVMLPPLSAGRQPPAASEPAGADLAVPAVPVWAVENVFIVVIDGLRHTEGFDDPLHQYIPHIWDELRPLGTIYTRCANLGVTATTAGHAAITSGAIQPFLPNTESEIYGGDIERIQEEPSIFQYYRSQLGIPQDKTWIINGKGKMLAYIGICLNPEYGSSFAPRVAFDAIQRDWETWAETQRVMDTHHPSLVLINLADVDGAGHTGSWTLYTNAIRNADAITAAIFAKIQADPHYAGRTALIVTSDHGRHSDGIASGFRDHGCSCAGCRRVPLLAIGSGIKADAVVDSFASLADIAPTVGAMLGFDVRFRNARVLRDMFVRPPPEEPRSLMDPVVAWSGGALHMAACVRKSDVLAIVYAQRPGGGGGWTSLKVLSSAPRNLYPRIAAEGDRVAVVWNEYLSDGASRVAGRESTDGGSSWSPRAAITGMQHYQYNLFPDACYDQGTLSVVWTEPRMVGTAVGLLQLRDHALVAGDSLVDDLAGRARCAASDGIVHVVYQRMNSQAKNFDIRYCRFAAGKWSAPSSLCATPGESVRPDIAADAAGGLHAVWAEERAGVFQIAVRNAAAGSGWDAGRLVTSSDRGAWHPALAPSPAGLMAVWEDYDTAFGARPVIAAAQSADGGSAWAAPFKLTPDVIDSVYPDAAVDGGGMLHVVWVKSPWPAWFGYRCLQL